MALANVTTLNTYYEWMIRTNQLIILNNLMTEGQHNTSGTITISGGGLAGNVSLNVANGLIKGDGGLVANLRNASLDANSLNIVSNTAALTVSTTNGGKLGSKVFLTLASLSTDASDTSTSNIASAYLTNYASVTAGAAFTKGNNATITAIGAFDKANTIEGSSGSAGTTAAAAYGQANSATITASSAYGHANNANLSAGAAFNKANSANLTAASAYGWANTVNLTAGAAFTKANSANVTAVGAFAAANAANSLGQHTIWIPAGAWTPRVTSGPSQGTYTSGAQARTIPYLAFDTTTAEYATATVMMPKGWDRGGIVPQYSWTHPATTTNFGVTWGMSARSYNDNDALDQATSTIIQITDGGGTTNNHYISPESMAVTVTGVNSAEELVLFEVSRQVANTGDTMAVDAWLLGVKLHYTANTANDS